MSGWDINLAAWVIQDGNYPDFQSGQLAEFALEFDSHNISYAQPGRKAVQTLGGGQYRVMGEVVYTYDDLWVLDFGIQAYFAQKRPAWVKPGIFASGEINLSIDYYLYFEQLFKLPGVPPIIYSWKIDRISILDRAPTKRDRKAVQDERGIAYREVERTNAWQDNGGGAEYILHCTKLDDPPKFRSRTATYP